MKLRYNERQTAVPTALSIYIPLTDRGRGAGASTGAGTVAGAQLPEYYLPLRHLNSTVRQMIPAH